MKGKRNNAACVSMWRYHKTKSIQKKKLALAEKEYQKKVEKLNILLAI